MKLIFDERETSLYDLCMQSDIKLREQCSLEKKVIPLADILITNDDETTVYVYFERKSVSDLLASIKDGRYAEQSYRLSNCCENLHNVVYLIEGMLPPKDKKLVVSCIASLNYFKGFSVHRTVSIQETAFYLMAYADKLEREFAKGNSGFPSSGTFGSSKGSKAYNHVSTNGMLEASGTELQEAVPASVANYTSVVKVQKKANITPENIGELFLMQIPGISSTIAAEIMKPFKTFLEFVEHVKQNPAYLENIKLVSGTKSRKIGSNIVKSIQDFIFPTQNIENAS
jgi:ERCC4-type nuclease